MNRLQQYVRAVTEHAERLQRLEEVLQEHVKTWRREKLPKPIQDIGWKAHVRLCTRYRQLSARGKHANQVVVAIARARRAFMWALAPQVPMTTSHLVLEPGVT